MPRPRPEPARPLVDVPRPAVRGCLGAGARLGTAHLFFGCRNRKHDFIYEEELEAAVAGGALTQVRMGVCGWRRGGGWWRAGAGEEEEGGRVGRAGLVHGVGLPGPAPWTPPACPLHAPLVAASVGPAHMRAPGSPPLPAAARRLLSGAVPEGVCAAPDGGACGRGVGRAQRLRCGALAWLGPAGRLASLGV